MEKNTKLVELKAIELKTIELSKNIKAINDKYNAQFDTLIKKADIKLKATEENINNKKRMAQVVKYAAPEKFNDLMLKYKLELSEAKNIYNDSLDEIETLRHDKLKDSFFSVDMVKKRQMEKEFIALSTEYRLERQRYEDTQKLSQGEANKANINYLRQLQNRSGL